MFSRKQIYLLVLCLLVLLDIGRSIFARIGYAEPRRSVADSTHRYEWQEAA
jgi:hypothetical protein